MDATSSSQELISDADVAVASVLNAKLEFDEALLNENVALHCDTQGGENDAEDVSKYSADVKGTLCPATEEVQMGVDSVDEDADHYINFSRTVVVHEAAKDSSQVGHNVYPNSGSISQLDGADNDSESDTSEANAEGDTQEVGSSFRSQESEPLKHPNKGRSLGNRQLVCTISSDENQLPGDSIDQNAGSKTCEEQEITSLPENLIVVSSQHETSGTGGLEDQELSLTHLVTTEEEVLLDSESTEDSKEAFLDDTSGNFISADGRILEVKENSACPGEVCDSSSLNEGLNKASLLAIPTSSARNIVIVKPTTTTQRRYVTVQPRTQLLKAIKMDVPPYSVPVSVVSTSAPVSVTPLASVINGFGQAPKDTAKTRTIAIRIAMPKPVTEQSQPQCLGTPTSPQVLLVNRAGQILVKNPQTNTYQIHSANSPSYAHISQIARIIHSGNIIQRPVPKVTVIPVPQVGLAKSAPARIISYSSGNGAAQATQVLIRSLPQHYIGSQLQNISQPIERTDRAMSRNAREGGEKEMAQAIIDKAMASHREAASLLNPSQFQLSPYLNEHLSTESSQPSRLRSPPNILANSKPQVKVKRVSSVTERIGVKKCRTDFMDHTTPSSQEDLNRQEPKFGKC